MNTVIVEIAEEIKRYLEAHPNAADTLIGISRWWLVQQRVEESVENVEKALDYLVAAGAVRRIAGTDDQVIYARSEDQKI